MIIQDVLTRELGITAAQTSAVISLIDEGNTIPFISRYRKEVTGGMNDEQLRTFDERLRYLRGLEDRKNTILTSISEQGKLTDELAKKIDEAETLAVLEDLYRPYKPKRRTRAMIAREKGMEGLAQYLLSAEAAVAPEIEAEKYFSEDNDVTDAKTALQLAMDIIAGDLSDDAEVRAWIREISFDRGMMSTSEKAAKEEVEGKAAPKTEERRGVYSMYFDSSEAAKKMPGHRILAVNRGEKEGILNVSLEVPKEAITAHLEEKIGAGKNELTESYLKEAAADAYARLIAPSIEKEVRGALTETAQEGALKVFGANLTQLLMQPPIQGKTVLGWDPAFRTGCKLAVVDKTGKILATSVIYPVEPHNRKAESARILKDLIKKYGVEIISVGNGTASRESEQFIADFIRETGLPVSYAIVNEAGASVYSASKLATDEYPDLDVGERSSASIARRLQDPLAELVKIDPKSIGVGQYQHDMDQKRLGEVLGGVVEDCVNRVGVDLNTASPSLLGYVSGVSKQVASNIVAYRDENGSFSNRKELLKVPKLGPKAFQQCAGFLRIRGGSEPLDMTAVHPESYDAAKSILKTLGYGPEDVVSGATKDIAEALKKAEAERREAGRPSVAEEAGVGTFTFKDIIDELAKPGRDPRDAVQAPILRSDVLSLEDLVPGMELKGTVRNIVDFGAFVDIGVHQDGLVHISEIADRFVKHPMDVVKVGDIVNVRVLSVDVERQKISLSMKSKDSVKPDRKPAGEKEQPKRDRRSSTDRNDGRGRRRNDRGRDDRRSSGGSGSNAMLEAFRRAQERKKK